MMSMRISLAAVVAILAVTSLSQPAFAEAPGEPNMLISIRYREETPGGKKPAILLVEPTVITTSDGSFSFLSGGKIPSKVGQDDLTFGTIAKGTVTRQKDGRFLLDLTLPIGEVPPQPEDAELVMYKTLRLRTLFKDGETKKGQIRKTQTYEIKLQKVDAL